MIKKYFRNGVVEPDVHELLQSMDFTDDKLVATLRDNGNFKFFNNRVTDPFFTICQYTECPTKNALDCIFPFKYKGRLYDTCITLDSDEPWCR